MVSTGIVLKSGLNAFNSINMIKCLLCSRHKANLWGCKNEAKNSCLRAPSRPDCVLWCVARCDQWQDGEELTQEGCLRRQAHLLKRCRNWAAGKEDRVGEAPRVDRPCAKAQQQERIPPARGTNRDLEWGGQGGEHGDGSRRGKSPVCLGEE